MKNYWMSVKYNIFVLSQNKKFSVLCYKNYTDFIFNTYIYIIIYIFLSSNIFFI